MCIVRRFVQGDITLVNDVLEQHDAVHNTVSAALVVTKPNEELVERKLRAKVEFAELALKEKRLELEIKEVSLEERKVFVEKERVACKKADVECTSFEIDNMERTRDTLDDVHVYTCIKDDFIQRKRLASSPPTSPNKDTNPMHNKDITTLAHDAGFGHISDEDRRALGQTLAKEYRLRYHGATPRKTQKLVNGANRPVNVYPPCDFFWVTEVIKRHFSHV